MASQTDYCCWCGRYMAEGRPRKFFTDSDGDNLGYFCSQQCFREWDDCPGANAYIVNGNDSGCFITTAVCEATGLPDDCRELSVLRHFRDSWMRATPERSALVERYYALAPGMVAWLDAQPARDALYATLRTDFILPAVEAAAAGRSEEAERLYTAMVRHLEEQREIG